MPNVHSIVKLLNSFALEFISPTIAPTAVPEMASWLYEFPLPWNFMLCHSFLFSLLQHAKIGLVLSFDRQSTDVSLGNLVFHKLRYWASPGQRLAIVKMRSSCIIKLGYLEFVTCYVKRICVNSVRNWLKIKQK